MPLVSNTSGDVTVVRHADGDIEAPSSNYWADQLELHLRRRLSALAVALIVGLAGAAVGAQQLCPGGRIARWSDVGFGALVFSVLVAFFSFVVVGKINGYRRAETEMLHGAIVWFVALPILVVLAALGAAHCSVAGTAAWRASPCG